MQILAFMVLPLLAVRSLGHRPASLGLGLGGIRRPLEVGLTALAIAGPASGVAFPLLGALGWSPYSWPGGCLLAAVYLACVPLTGLVIRKLKPEEGHVIRASVIAAAVAILAAGLVAAALTSDAAPIVSRVLLTLLIVGPGEELLFRGIVQTRLDLAFGRPLAHVRRRARLGVDRRRSCSGRLICSPRSAPGGAAGRSGRSPPDCSSATSARKAGTSSHRPSSTGYWSQ